MISNNTGLFAKITHGKLFQLTSVCWAENIYSRPCEGKCNFADKLLKYFPQILSLSWWKVLCHVAVVFCRIFGKGECLCALSVSILIFGSAFDMCCFGSSFCTCVGQEA